MHDDLLRHLQLEQRQRELQDQQPQVSEPRENPAELYYYCNPPSEENPNPSMQLSNSTWQNFVLYPMVLFVNPVVALFTPAPCTA